MANEIKQLWKRLTESRILDESVCSTFKQNYDSSGFDEERNPENLAHWLCEQKAVSRFQANILLSGCSGPFRFGNYLVVDQLNAGPACCRFVGRHVLTGHPVVLDFIGGGMDCDLNRWNTVQRSASLLAKNQHPNLPRIFETVAIPEYRFAVSQLPRGKPLSERLPEKARIGWKQATDIVGQLASVIDHLHKLGLAHGSIAAEWIWLGTSNFVQLPYLFSESIASDRNTVDELQSKQLDVKNLGMVWYRLLTGRFPDSDSSDTKSGNNNLRRLKKYDVPDQVATLIRSLLTVGSDGMECDKVVALCCQLTGTDSVLRETLAPLSTLADYESWLVRTPDSLAIGQIEKVDTSQLQFAGDAQPQPSVAGKSYPDQIGVTEAGDGPSSHAKPGDYRHRSKFTALVSIVGSSLAIFSLLGIVVALTTNKPNSAVVNVPEAIVESSEPTSNSTGSDHASSDPPANDVGATVDSAGLLDQVLIDDDGQSLWEAPTSGREIDFSFVPSFPKIAFGIRLSDILAIDEGKRVQQALGPELNERIERWRQNTGLEMTDIEDVLVTLHSNQDFTYEPFFVVYLKSAIPKDELLMAWNNPEPLTNSNGVEYFCRDDKNCFAIVQAETEVVQKFIYGPKWLVEESLELEGANVIAGSIKRLASWSDRDRHLTIMFLRSGLFDDEGQKLMSRILSGLNRQLSLAIDNNIRGGLFSLHLDNDAYVELRFDPTVDLKNEALEQHVAELLNKLRETTSEYSKSLSPSSYWKNVHVRYTDMIADFTNRWRIGVEEKQVIANCWLPATATHNLIAGTELMLSLGQQVGLAGQGEDPSAVPQSLTELLALPRDLSVSTSPDLIVLINNLQQEIRDDYGKLPFDFEIRFMGADLSKEGITQNQRPSDFDLKQKPLSEILTEIMVKANPDKNITGASDLNCKMVWVVAEDPDEPTRQIILITTRAAATENSWSLPPAFAEK